MYVDHPSPELNDLFARKPYQGVDPDQSTFLFVGQDANYDENIEKKSIFPKILEYHDDGASFWRKYNVHHPFLLPEYSGGGKSYHRGFSRIGFGPQHADLVSFVELLHVPTVGRNKLDATDLQLSHLRMLNTTILEGQAAHIFIPAKVANLMRITGAFPWLGKGIKNPPGLLRVLFRNHTKTVYSHLHFSVYGKFEQQKSQEAIAIRAILSQSTNDKEYQVLGLDHCFDQTGQASRGDPKTSKSF
ncbi:MAG: hypothetical protein HW380_711 [Magnetococcales bacterium]|nr:hypothetical protein [Magnetococcales bacterium]